MTFNHFYARANMPAKLEQRKGEIGFLAYASYGRFLNALSISKPTIMITMIMAMAAATM